MELTLYVSVESFLDDYESRRMELGSSSIQNSVDNIARFGWYDRRYVDVTSLARLRSNVASDIRKAVCARSWWMQCRDYWPVYLV